MAKQGTITAPQKPATVPEGAQWLGGEGGGVWFCLSKPEDAPETYFRIQRYAPDGKLDCDRLFSVKNGRGFDHRQPYQFTYISHCQKCRVLQGGEVVEFVAVGSSLLK